MSDEEALYSPEAIKSCPDKGCKNIISLPDQNLPLKAAGLTPLWWPGPPATADQSELSWRGADQSERSILSQTLSVLRGEERRGEVRTCPRVCPRSELVLQSYSPAHGLTCPHTN